MLLRHVLGLGFAPLSYTAPAQDIEKKLEADLATIGVTILFAVGFITLEFGINDLIGEGSRARHGCHPGARYAWRGHPDEAGPL